MRTLEELSHDSFYNMQNYSQITIDFIEELEDLISIGDSEFSGLAYTISTVLDIINPELKTDKEALLNLIEIMSYKAEYL